MLISFAYHPRQVCTQRVVDSLDAFAFDFLDAFSFAGSAHFEFIQVLADDVCCFDLSDHRAIAHRKTTVASDSA